MKERFDMGIVVTNIQRMCFHDGPGIRSTVFMKGCGIHCPWCANPENISFQIQQYCEKGKNGRERPWQYGKEYEAEELIHILEKDRPFWGEDGGVTFSGGEPLLHVGSLLPVWRRLKEMGIHMAAETSLFVPSADLEAALEFIDFFYVDVKLLDSELCARVLGGDTGQYLKNVDLLAKSGKEFCFRIPCSVEYVLQPRNMEKVYEFLSRYSKVPVEIFAIHNLGESKYRNLQITPENFQVVPEEQLQELKCQIEEIGNTVSIIKI